MKVKLGNKAVEEYQVPDVFNMVRCFRGETLFIFGVDSERAKYRWCLGVGYVIKIKQGENFDLVYINFGKNYWREIIVQYNHARRQLLTLKCGQYATFYGKFKYDFVQKKMIFYAYGLQAWYVPKSMDIKQMDLASYEKMKLEEEKSMINLIDDLVGTKEKK